MQNSLPVCPVRKGEILKKLLCVFCLVATLICLVSCQQPTSEEPSISVYVTVSDKGNAVVRQEEVSVIDYDKDGKYTVDDVLFATHNQKYEGGAKTGYGSSLTQYGFSLAKLWGDASGAFSYYVNNESAFSLADEVKEGDYVTAFVYSDQVAWSDSYSFFSQNRMETTVGENVLVELNNIGFDTDFNIVAQKTARAKITCNGAVKAISDDNGQAALSFSEKGEYLISAESDEILLVPAFCKIIVR